jgi:transcriptional regulator GlxA family with amidase domain
MRLVPLSSVPQVGVLLHPHVELASSMSVLSVMVATDGVRAFTVADTDEPLRTDDALEVRPQFALADAPALDVLVVPAGWGAHEDELILEWVAESAAGAQFVLSVGTGSVVLARAGVLDEKEPVPVPERWVQRGAQLVPDLTLAAEPAWRRVGNVFLARDAEAGVEAALVIAFELLGEAPAREAALRLGRAWEPPRVGEDE